MATPGNPLLNCQECGEVSHSSCAGIERVVVEHNGAAMERWKCTECVRCSGCKTIGKEDQLLVCDWCQQGYHTYCHKPFLKSIPETEKWLCSACASCPLPYCNGAVESKFWFEQLSHCSRDAESKKRGTAHKLTKSERECALLSSAPPSPPRDWTMVGTSVSMLEYWGRPVCEACWWRYRQGQFCQVCKDVYDMDDYSLQMVCCDKCDHWIHIRCAGLSTRQYNALSRAAESAEEGMAEDEEFVCPRCLRHVPDTPTLPPPSGQEIAIVRGCSDGSHSLNNVIHATTSPADDPRTCCLCPSGDKMTEEETTDVRQWLAMSTFLPFGQGRNFAHVQCAGLASGVSVGFGGELYGLGTAYKRSLKLECSVCGEAGATIGCHKNTCMFVAHLACIGSMQGGLFSTVPLEELARQPFGNVALVCPEHEAKVSRQWRRLSGGLLHALFSRIASRSLLDGKKGRFDRLADRGPALLRYGSLSVLSYGSLAAVPVEQLFAYSTRHRAYPVGYRAVKRFASTLDAGLRTSLELSVEAGESAPLFVITETSRQGETVTVRSPTPAGAWLEVVSRLYRARGGVGMDFATVVERLRREHELHLHLVQVIEDANCEPEILDADEAEFAVFFKELSAHSRAPPAASLPSSASASGCGSVTGAVPSETPRQLEARHLCSLGMDLFGLGLAWVCRELEHFTAGLERCRQFVFSHNTLHRSRPVPLPINRSGCARAEPLAKRQRRLGFRMQSALAGDDQASSLSSLSSSSLGDGSRLRGSSSAQSLATGGPMLPYAMQYRQLKASPTKIRVGRSKIQGFGVFAIDNISRGEMFVEYIGEIIRQSVADLREKRYEAKGVGCYMFRLTNDEILDATFTGNIARFINHSCEPSAGTRKIHVGGEYKIVIYALRDIRKGEEVCYDYKFPIEEEKIPCHCGAKRCRGTMN